MEQACWDGRTRFRSVLLFRDRVLAVIIIFFTSSCRDVSSRVGYIVVLEAQFRTEKDLVRPDLLLVGMEGVGYSRSARQ